jgi:3',5'-cyclic AMP phosphodiesterase CpdA
MAAAKILQLSDLHLTGNGGTLFGSSPWQRLAAAFDSIRREHADALLCLLTGDLADAGEPEAYRELARRCADLPMPVCPLPGNHDERTALQAAFPGRAEGPFFQYGLDTAIGRFLFLDTLDPGRAAGRYCAARQAWLRAQLATDETPLWLAMHHPPFATGIPAMDRYALADGEALWSCLVPARQRIRHLFFGHLHRPIGGHWRGISVSCTGSPNHQVALDLQSAPANGDVPGCAEAPSYAVILCDEDCVLVHHHQFLDRSQRFPL